MKYSLVSSLFSLCVVAIMQVSADVSNIRTMGNVEMGSHFSKTGASVMWNGDMVNPEGCLLNSAAQRVDAQGNPIGQQGLMMFTAHGDVLDPQGNKINLQGMTMTSNGNIVNSIGCSIDAQGNRLDVHGNKIISSPWSTVANIQGCLVDAQGSRFDVNNNMVTPQSGVMSDVLGNVYDVTGARNNNVAWTDAQRNMFNSVGCLINAQGNRIDVQGNRIDSQGNHIDVNGNIISGFINAFDTSSMGGYQNWWNNLMAQLHNMNIQQGITSISSGSSSLIARDVGPHYVAPFMLDLYSWWLGHSEWQTGSAMFPDFVAPISISITQPPNSLFIGSQFHT